MESSIFKKVSKGDFRGRMRRDVLDHLPPHFFDNPISSIQEMGGEGIKESRWRRSAIFFLRDGRRVFFKRDKTKGWTESVKYLFLPSKGRKEFLIASNLEGENLNIPKPFGWMERVQRGWVRESYYLSEAIGRGGSFIDDPTKSKEVYSILELAKTVRKFQNKGLLHQDLHGGNFLWDGDSLFLTDLHDAKIGKPLSLNQRLWNLAHLFHSLRSMWSEEEQLQFLDQYFEEISDGAKKREILSQKIYPIMGRLQKRQWRSRTKRCLKESTEFTTQREKRVRYFHRRDFPLDRLKSAMEEHQDLVRENPSSLIKNSPEVVVSILNHEGERVCLKQFRYPHLWDSLKEHFRRPKGLKSWMAANGMRARGIPSLKPLALVERANWVGLKDSFLFMEALTKDQEMDRYILKGFESLNKKRLFIRTFAGWLDRLHKMGLYHKDMKTCNILVSEGEERWDFHLLDFEDLLMDEQVNRKKLFRNFVQLNTSTPKVMTKVDRFRFFKAYLRLNPIVQDQKSFLQDLLMESRRRGLVYVSPKGVVIEKMSF
jgi:tRNA A-37 threonylcarbamoyl transferase component Bud32